MTDGSGLPADAGLPLLINMARQRAVCVGGGPVATSKVRSLLEVGADVVVVSPDATAELVEAAGAGRCDWRRRTYAAGDLTGALLVVAATASPQVNAVVARDAAALPVLCVRVDAVQQQAVGGTAAFLATVRRGPLLLAVSTSGQAPSLARRIRADLERTYDDAWGACAALFGQLRRDPQVRAALAGLPAAERRRRWRSIPVPDIVALLRNGSPSNAKDVATACLSSSSD